MLMYNGVNVILVLAREFTGCKLIDQYLKQSVSQIPQMSSNRNRWRRWLWLQQGESMKNAGRVLSMNRERGESVKEKCQPRDCQFVRMSQMVLMWKLYVHCLCCIIYFVPFVCFFKHFHLSPQFLG